MVAPFGPQLLFMEFGCCFVHELVFKQVLIKHNVNK